MPPGAEERIFTPGATISGFALSVNFEGPRKENFATLSSLRIAPTANASGKEAGVPMEPSPPLLEAERLPAEKTGNIPALRHCFNTGRKNSLWELPPQELFIMRGASSGWATPFESLGASIHCAASRRRSSLVSPLSSNTRAPIHFAPGATPVCEPRIVPVT